MDGWTLILKTSFANVLKLSKVITKRKHMFLLYWSPISFHYQSESRSLLCTYANNDKRLLASQLDRVKPFLLGHRFAHDNIGRCRFQRMESSGVNSASRGMNQLWPQDGSNFKKNANRWEVLRQRCLRWKEKYFLFCMFKLMSVGRFY